MTFALQAQLSWTASRKLGQQQSGVHGSFTSSCTSLVPYITKRAPSLKGSEYTRQRHHGPAVLVTAKMNMRVMVKLSVARSSGKLDLSDCGLTEVPAEVCDLRDLEASTAPHQQFFALILVCLSSHLSSCQPLLLVYCLVRPPHRAIFTSTALSAGVRH